MKKRIPYITNNRKKIIYFCKKNDGNINKAQIMNLLKCSCDSAYDIYKSMLKCGLLEKTGKCKFKLNTKTI
jgi:hypothetical protein